MKVEYNSSKESGLEEDESNNYTPPNVAINNSSPIRDCPLMESTDTSTLD